MFYSKPKIFSTNRTNIVIYHFRRGQKGKAPGVMTFHLQTENIQLIDLKF